MVFRTTLFKECASGCPRSSKWRRLTDSEMRQRKNIVIGRSHTDFPFKAGDLEKTLKWTLGTCIS